LLRLEEILCDEFKGCHGRVDLQESQWQRGSSANLTRDLGDKAEAGFHSLTLSQLSGSQGATLCGLIFSGLQKNGKYKNCP
jgi:hypothetical protein